MSGELDCSSREQDAAAEPVGSKGDVATRPAFALAVVLVLVHGASSWIGSYRCYPEAPISVHAVLRPAGDPDYYPFIRGLSRFTLAETNYLESLGEGIRPFPVVSLLPHAVCLRIFGDAGLMVADVLVNLAFFLSLLAFLRAFGIAPGLAIVASLMVSTELCQELVRRAWVVGFVRPDLDLTFWDMRIPRPFVSSVFLLLTWTCLLRVVTDRAGARRLRWWVLLALCFSLLLQSDLYSAISCALLIALAALVAWRGDPRRTGRLLTHVAVALAVCCVASGVFICQQILAEPDVVRRYGVFDVSRTAPLISLACRWRFVAMVVGFTAIIWPFHRLARATGRDGRTAALRVGYLLIATIVSFFALPVSCVLLGKAVQVNHFDDRFEVFTSYGCLVVLLMLLQEGTVFAISRPASKRWGRIGRHGAATVTWTAIAACALGGAWQAWQPPDTGFRWLGFGDPAASESQPSRERYWADYIDLIARLQEPSRHRDAEVLGTFDSQLLAWWTSFGPESVFVAHAFATVATDRTQERRLCLFCRILGLDGEQFPEFVQRYYVNSLYLGCAKYQASSAYTFSTLDDYRPEDREVIVKKSVDDSWHLVIPNSELSRLKEQYNDTSLSQSEFQLPDVIVLTSFEVGLGLRPIASLYARTYRNGTFTVWVRRSAKAS